MKIPKKILFLGLLSLTLLAACSSSDDSAATPTIENNGIKYVGTQSPGDVWEWELNDNDHSFSCVWDYGTFEKLSDDITITGSFEKFPSGFLKCTIESVSPANEEIPADGTAWFYALRLPNMAMIVKPEGAIKGDLIAAVTAGDCADVAGDYNYFLTAFGNSNEYDVLEQEAYGRATFLENGNNTFDIHGDSYSLDCINDGVCTVNTGIQDSPMATCTGGGGIVINSEDDRSIITKGQFTQSGVMMLDRGKGNRGVFAFNKKKILTIEAIDQLEFVGLAYSPSNEDDKVVPVHLSFKKQNGFLKGSGTPYQDIVTGALENESVALEFNTDESGLIYGKIQHNDDEQTKTNFVSSIIDNGESKMIALSSTNSSNDPFIVLAVSK